MFIGGTVTASSLEQTVAAFLEIGEAIATRWIQTAKGVLVLQMVPDNDASGAVYIFDRQHERWYMLSFEACEDQFTSEQFDRAFSEYRLFKSVEHPSLCSPTCQPRGPNFPLHVPITQFHPHPRRIRMRLSASRIRSINRRMARVQGLARPGRDRSLTADSSRFNRTSAYQYAAEDRQDPGGAERR